MGIKEKLYYEKTKEVLILRSKHLKKENQIFNNLYAYKNPANKIFKPK